MIKKNTFIYVGGKLIKSKIKKYYLDVKIGKLAKGINNSASSIFF
jgi:hypothetical protein